MDSGKLTDWLQGVGLFALVGSLVFVGLQMRQTHEIAEATLYQMRSDAARELMTAQLGSEVLADIEAKVSEGGELSVYEIYARSLMPLIFFNHFENSHYLYESGFLGEEHWASDLAAIRYYVLENDLNWGETWNKQKGIFRPSFVQDVDAALQD